MFQDLLQSNGTATKFADLLQGVPLNLWHGLYVCLRVFQSSLLLLVRTPLRLFAYIFRLLVASLFFHSIVPFIQRMLGEDTDVPQHWQRRLYANSRALLSRLLELTQEKTPFFSVVVDYWTLVRSIWSGGLLGPDVVYPMLRIRKRQSGRLARLILEHCNVTQEYERNAETPFPHGIDPPCVAVMDLDQVPPHIVQNGYSTRVDFYGLMFVPIFSGTLIALASLDSSSWYRGLSVALDHWITHVHHILAFCIYAVLRGDGTLMLARQSNTSTPGCAVLLDQDFTVILNGNQSVLEAIAERGFNTSHPKAVWRPRVSREGEQHRCLSHDTIEISRDAICLTAFILYWYLFCMSTQLERATPLVFAAIGVFRHPLTEYSTVGEWSMGSVLVIWLIICVIFCYGLVKLEGFPLLSGWQDPVPLTLFLFAFLLFAYKPRNYPIRSTKLLDALGNPPVRKWRFDTLAAAATFQCLVLCHRIPRPVTTINVSAFLDMLIPDERDVWKAWKDRVADRIVHETDILFAPTVPTFADERQVQLRDLLAEAQSGYDTYSASYASGASQELTKAK